jgi:hypothetical protein
LTDDQLILLDALFYAPTSAGLLRRDGFHHQWNFGYAHALDDAELDCHLRWLCEHGVLERETDAESVRVALTAYGGELWSQERCPAWERFCKERYATTSRGRTRMTVLAASPEIRDDFLRLWPPTPARFRKAAIDGLPLIDWHPFPRLFVGVATYEEQLEFNLADYAEDCQRHTTVERERSWWRNVSELQRFVNG